MVTLVREPEGSTFLMWKPATEHDSELVKSFTASQPTFLNICFKYYPYTFLSFFKAVSYQNVSSPKLPCVSQPFHYDLADLITLSTRLTFKLLYTYKAIFDNIKVNLNIFWILMCIKDIGKLETFNTVYVSQE